MVRVRRDDIAWPRRCAVCGEPEQARALLTRPSLGSHTLLSVPTCGRCELDVFSLTSYVPMGISFAVAVVCGTAFAVVLGWASLVVVIAISAAATGLAYGVSLQVISRLLASRRHAAGQARVRLLSSTSDVVEIYCGNQVWALELAEASGGTLTAPRPRGMGRISLLVGLASAGASLFPALISFRYSHCPLSVDNASGETIVLVVDGEDALTVPTNAQGDEPPKVWIRTGRHQVGFRTASRSTPISTLVELSSDPILYNPGKSACYARVQSVYSSSGDLPGSVQMLERAELYRVGDIDDWFTPSPDTVEMSESSSPLRRLAWLRNSSCTELVRSGCAEETVTELIRCQERAATTPEFERCAVIAQKACGLTSAEPTGEAL